MLYLLDSNILSDLMAQRPGAIHRLEQITDGNTALICPVVRGEVLHGIYRLPHGERRRRLQDRADHLFSSMAFEPVPAEAGDRYAEIKLLRQRKGKRMDENDLWIAATAVAWGATLVSLDRDFHDIDGLNLDDWSEPVP